MAKAKKNRFGSGNAKTLSADIESYTQKLYEQSGIGEAAKNRFKKKSDSGTSGSSSTATPTITTGNEDLDATVAQNIEILKRNNPAAVAALLAGSQSGDIAPVKSPAKSKSDTTSPVQINALGAGDYGASKSKTGKTNEQVRKENNEAAAAVRASQKADTGGTTFGKDGTSAKDAPWWDMSWAADATYGTYSPGNATGRTKVGNTVASGVQDTGSSFWETLGFVTDQTEESKPTEADMAFGYVRPDGTVTEPAETLPFMKKFLSWVSGEAYKKSDTLAKEAQESRTMAKEGAGKVGSLLVDAGSAATQMAGDALLGAATGTGLAPLGVRAFGGGVREAREAGASRQEQFNYGVSSAAVEVLTEKIGSVALPFRTVYGVGAVDDLVENLVKQSAKTPLGRAGLSALFSAVSEGGEEVISDVLNPILKTMTYNPEGYKEYGTPEYWSNMLRDGIIGAGLGAVGGGGQVVSAVGQSRAEGKAYGADPQALIDSGLETAEGSKAHELAQEMQQKLDDGDKISGKEYKKLAKAIDAEYAAEQGQPEASTAETSAQSVPFIPYSNTARSNAAQNIASQGSRSFSSIVNDLGGRTAIVRSAEKNNVSAEVVERVYNLNPDADVKAFNAAFDAAVQMGQQNANADALSNVPVLTAQQAKIAYTIGQSKAQTIQKTNNSTVDSAVSKAQSGTISLNDVRPILADKTALTALQRLTGKIDLKGKSSAEQRESVRNAIIKYVEDRSDGVHIRDGGERLNGEDTEGQVSSVEAGAGKDKGGRAETGRDGSTAAQGKAGQRVVYDGVTQKNAYYHTGEETEDMKNSRRLAESYGYKVTFFEGGNIRVEGGSVRGVVDTNNKTVMVRTDHSDLTALQIMQHEMGHAAIAEGDISLDELREVMLSDFTAKELDRMALDYASALTTDGGELVMSIDEAFEEICCDALGKINIFAGTKQNSASYVKAQRNIRKYAAEKNSSKGRAPPESGSTMYSREVNGKQIAYIEDNPLSLKDLTNYKKVAAYIAEHVGEAYTILESGYKVYIGENLPKEYTQSEYTKALLRNNQPILRAKKKAIGSFGEMIEIATNRRWEKTKHAANKDAKYGVYRYSTAFAFPVKQNGKITSVKSFDAELVILNSSDGKKYLYDIVNIKENTADETDLMKRDQRRQNAATRRSVSENSIRNSEENVKKNTAKTAEKFSMEAPVEQKENLIALHNLDETKLLKTLKLGGFPMPSIAITKSDIPHTNFGNITIVFGKETIDPKFDKRNTVYSADAWTPTFPQIEYEASPKTEKKIRDIYYPLSRKYGFDFTRPLYESVNYLGDTLTRYGGEKGLMEKFADDVDMMNVFLAASGKEPIKAIDKEIVTRLPDTEVEMYDYLANAIGEETVYDMQMRSGENPISAKRRWVSEHEQDIISAWQGYLTDVVGMSREVAEAETSEMEAKSLTQTFVKARNYLKNGAETRRTEPDTDAQRKAIRAAVNKTEYKAWLENLYSGAVKNSGVYNNKDVYTSSGNMRSFKALHFPATLDGIVSAMASQNKGSTKNVSGFHGVKTLRAGTAERFGSIEDMHKLEGRLSHLTEEEAEEIHSALSERLSTQMNEIYNLIPHSGNDYIGLDALGEIYMEAAELKYKSTANVKALFKKYRYNLSDKQANDVVALLFDINNMPVNIFEAKPERAVSFDEIRKVIIPDTSSDELRTALKNAGIESVEEYAAGDDAARMRIANAVPNVHFSREYEKAKVNPDIVSLANAVKSGDYNSRSYVELGTISGSVAQQLERTVGIDFTGYKLKLEARQIQHIFSDHGEKGKSDHSLSNVNDLAKMQFAIEQATNISYAGKTNAYTVFENGKSRPANTVIYEKDIGAKSYYVVQTAVDTKKKTLYIVTAFIGEKGYKNGDTLSFDGKTPEATPKSATASSPSTNISDNAKNVKASREPETLNELRRQNKVLRERVDYWKRQTKPTKVKQLRMDDIRRLAKEVVSMSETDLKPKDITEGLTELGKYLLNEPELRYTDVSEMAEDIAADVIENATAIVNEEDTAIHNELRDYLKRVKLRDDGSAEFESIRSSYKRRIMFDKNGLGVDTAYAELHDMFGEGYFPEDIVNPANQLERIAEVLDNTAPKYANPNGYYAKEATEFLRNYIIDSMLGEDMRQAAPTYADKAEAKLAAAKAQSTQRLNEQKAEYDEKISNIKAQNKKRVKKAIAEERQRGEKRLQRFRDSVESRDAKRKETAEKNRYKAQIEKNVKTLSDWLLKPDHKNALKHISGELQSTVRDFIASIDFTSARQLGGGAATAKDMRYLSNLERLHRYITDKNVGEDRYSGYLDLPPNFETELGNFIHEVNALARKNSGYTINDMTVEQLKELSDIVKTMKKTITDMNRMYQNRTFQHAYDAGASDVATLKGYVRTKAFTTNLAANRLDQTVMWEQSRPAHVFKRFGKGGESIYREFADAQGTMAFLTKEVLDFASETYDSKEVKAWAKETHTFEFGSDEVTLTTAQLMSLYELNKRAQAKQHISAGGFRVANFKNGRFKMKADNGAHVFAEADLQSMFSELTDRQKEVADKLQRFMVERGGEWGNYVSVKRFDVEMFKDENYFPIKVDNGQIDAKETESVDNASLYQLLNMGFAKDVSAKANQAIVVYDIFDVFANHMAEMAQYRSFALPVLDAMKWFNYKERNENGVVTASFREEMRRAFGSDINGRGFAEKFITGVIKAYNGAEGRGDNSVNSRMLNRVNRAAVAYNTRVMIQQPSAIVRAAMYLDARDLAASLKNYVGITTKKNITEMHKYSGIAVWKDLGFYDVNVSRGVQELIKNGQGTISRINEIGMKGAELADKVTWAALWDASKKKVRRDTGLSESDAEFFPKVVRLFEDTVYNTQVVDTVLTKSAFSRDKSFSRRLFSSFMSEPMTTASLVTNEIFDIQMKQAAGQKLRPSDYSRLGKTVVVVAVAAVVNSMLASLADAWRDDDDYGTFGEKWLRALRVKLADELNPLTYLPYGSVVWDAFKTILDSTGQKWFGLDVYGNGTDLPLSDIIDATEKVLNIFQEINEKGESSKYTMFGGFYKTVNIISKISGVPIYNLMREGVSLYNNILPDSKLRSYEPSPKSAVQFAWRDGYLTDEEAIAALQDEEAMGSDALDEGAAWLEVEKWKTGASSNYTKLYDALDNDGDIKSAVDELKEHGVEEKNIKSAVTRKYKDAYINGDNAERERIRRAMYATGLYGSVNEVIKKCNSWLEKTK